MCCSGCCARKELGFEVLFEVENVRNPFYKALNPDFNNSNCVDDFWGLKLQFETNYLQPRGSLVGDCDKNCRVRKYTPHPILIKHCVAVSSATSNVAHHARVFPVFLTCISPSSKMHLCGGGQGALWLYLVIHLDMDSLSPWGAPGWTEGP